MPAASTSAAGPSATPLLPKETTPSIAVANNVPTNMVTIELLDKSKNNWTRWRRVVLQCLQYVGLSEYIHGTIPCPDPTQEPRAARNWHITNGAVVAFLGLKSSEEEQEFIEGKTLAC